MSFKERSQKILKSRAFWWFWVAVLISLLIWFVGPAISFYDFAPFANVGLQIILIMITFLVWLYCHFKGRIKQHLQGTKIFHDEDEATPKLTGHISRRQSRLLKKDFKRMKDIVLARAIQRYWLLKRNNIYDLPWYLVLGAQGVGKTSLVRQLHLQFIRQSYSDFDMQSQAFHYALSEEAMLLDVDHKLFTQKTLKERHLWLTLLKCIKRARPKRPLNGVILTLSVKDLLTHDRELKQKLFEQVRLRLHELQQRLGMQIPVYVVVTHLDELSGFTDFVLRFTESEREEMFGITFSSKSELSSIDQLPFEYDVLMQHINHRLERDLEGEYLPETHSRMWYFSVQMAALKEAILEFAKEIFLTRRILHKNDWRGIYFVAHTLQGEQRFDVVTCERNLSMLQVPRFLKDKSFFVAHILKEALLPEQEYVGMHPLFLRHWGLFSQGRTIVAALLTMMILISWLISTHQYLNYNDQVLWSLAHAEPPVKVSGDASLNEIYPSLDLLGHLYHQSDDAFMMHLGLWVHNSAHEGVKALYLQALQQQFLPYVLNTLANNLAVAITESNHGESMAHVEDLYFYLSSYLMFNKLNKMDTSQVSNVLDNYWRSAFSDNLVLQGWLDTRLNDLLLSQLTAQTLNANLIKTAQAALLNSPIYMQAYLRLKLNALQNNAKNINVAGELNADATEVFLNLNHATVPLFYTREGYEKIYKAQAKKYLEDTENASWVFGDNEETHYSSEDLDNFRSQMDALYWQDYLDAWNNALSEVNLASFSDLQTEMSVLTLLTSKNSPFNHLLKNIEANTDFNNEALSESDHLFSNNKTVQTASNYANQNNGNIVSNQFAPLISLINAPASQPTQLQNIQTNLTALQQYLSGLANSSNPGLSAYNASVAIFQGQADRSITALATIATQMPQPMSRWLNQIVANTYAAIFASADNYIMSEWQANVASFYQQALAGRYPFVRSQSEVTIQDFSNFFKPGGVEDSFVKKYLAPFITTDSFGHVEWVSVNNVSLSNDLALINEISEANQIRNTFFGSASGALNFTLTPQSLSGAHKFTFNYDGKSVDDSGKSSTGVGFVWPPANTDGTVSMTYTRLLLSNVTKTYPGPWGLFRALEGANLVKSKYGSSYNVNFDNDDMSAGFLLSASSVNNPFDIRILRNYSCPE